MACVGIFDSGLGGLTVWSALRQHLPQLPCLYLADQAHLPYGPRSTDNIQDLCVAATHALRSQGAELIVVACNTASAAALEHLRTTFPDLAFVGMEPAVKPAALQTRSGVVGLMATRGTLQGALLRNTAARFAGHVEIVASDCPGLAEAIETDAKDLDAQLRKHLEPMLARGADTVVLGCTHYPLAMTLIRRIVGPDVHIIDPSPAIARQVGRLWQGASTSMATRFATTAEPTHLGNFLRQRFQTDVVIEHWHWRNQTLVAQDHNVPSN